LQGEGERVGVWGAIRDVTDILMHSPNVQVMRICVWACREAKRVEGLRLREEAVQDAEQAKTQVSVDAPPCPLVVTSHCDDGTLAHCD